ncbi:MAG: TlpA family protein disulfide reductase [Alphaproteobacteria bacterium]|nr:TlpA family protein disulfide reductase [Alphaproteobacteria bacterium]
MPQKSFTKIVILVSFALSAAFGGFLIYNQLQKEQQLAAKPVTNELQTLAKGELAAFLVNAEPLDLPQIKFFNASAEDKLLSGKDEIDLSHFRGKTILVNLWATWCGPCRHEMPTLDKLQAKLGSDKFEVVTLNVDRKSTAGAEAFFSEIGIKNLSLYADPSTKAMRNLRARGLPMTMLINADGKEVGRIFGPAEWSSEEAINLIQAEINSNS